MDKNLLLDDGHWAFENYVQRITTKQWRELLLVKDDYSICKGTIRQLVGVNLGCGVIEISKEPIKPVKEERDDA